MEEWAAIIDRPLPSWYADMKLGIFIHWGPYSVPSYGSEWFWHNYACGNKKVKELGFTLVMDGLLWESGRIKDLGMEQDTT